MEVSLWDSLPDELVDLIFQYAKGESQKLSILGERYPRIFESLVEKIKKGFINPDICFHTERYEYKYEFEYNFGKFRYPIMSFLEKEGSWDINSIRFKLDEEDDMDRYNHLRIILKEDDSIEFENPEKVPDKLKLSKELLCNKFSNIYYLQEGENDYRDWIILAKSGEYYIFFEATCCYTGFIVLFAF